MSALHDERLCREGGGPKSVYYLLRVSETEVLQGFTRALTRLRVAPPITTATAKSTICVNKILI